MNFENWTKDNYSQKMLNDYYRCYIEQFSFEHREFVEKLFSKIDYLNDLTGVELCDDYCKIINTLYKDAPLVSTIIDNRCGHNSESFYHNLSALDLKIKKIPSVEKMTKHKKIVICDDYSGTGDTIINVINEIMKLYNAYVSDGDTKEEEKISASQWWDNLEVVVFPAIITEVAYRRLYNYLSVVFDNNKFQINYLQYRRANLLHECGSFHDIDKEKLDEINIGWSIPNDYKYGFGQTGEHLAMYYGTPNNTIGFLWMSKNKDLVPFFRRKQTNYWYRKKDEFKIVDYDSYAFVMDTIKYLKLKLSMAEKKLLLYKMINYSDKDILKIVDISDYDSVINGFIARGLITQTGDYGERFPQEIKEKIKQFMLGINYSEKNKKTMIMNQYK